MPLSYARIGLLSNVHEVVGIYSLGPRAPVAVQYPGARLRAALVTSVVPKGVIRSGPGLTDMLRPLLVGRPQCLRRFAY
jgi:hypothetical protein